MEESGISLVKGWWTDLFVLNYSALELYSLFTITDEMEVIQGYRSFY